MNKLGRHYVLAGLCVISFFLAQTFQASAYWFLIPASHRPQDDLLKSNQRCPANVLRRRPGSRKALSANPTGASLY